MEAIVKFSGESPYLTFILCWVFLVLSCHAFNCVFFLLPNRFLRHWNIRKHGYPPTHCDADGDFKPEKTEVLE